MKRWLLPLWLVWILLPLTVQAQAESGPEEDMLTGGELLNNCQPRPDDQAEGEGEEGVPTSYCMQFVFGLVRTLAGLQEMAPEEDWIFCINPNEIALEDVTTKVTDWLEAHPERLQEPAFLLTSEALRDNYPCSTTPQNPDST